MGWLRLFTRQGISSGDAPPRLLGILFFGLVAVLILQWYRRSKSRAGGRAVRLVLKAILVLVAVTTLPLLLVRPFYSYFVRYVLPHHDLTPEIFWLIWGSLALLMLGVLLWLLDKLEKLSQVTAPPEGRSTVVAGPTEDRVQPLVSGKSDSEASPTDPFRVVENEDDLVKLEAPSFLETRIGGAKPGT